MSKEEEIYRLDSDDFIIDFEKLAKEQKEKSKKK